MQQEALKTALHIYNVLEDKRRSVTLKCRLEGSPKGTEWMYIQPGVWTEIVDVMEFLLPRYDLPRGSFQVTNNNYVHSMITYDLWLCGLRINKMVQCSVNRIQALVIFGIGLM